MLMMKSNRVIEFSELLYRSVLVAYPAAYRREYGGLMAQLFRDQSLTAYTEKGMRGLAVLWLRTIPDLLNSLLTAYAEKLQDRSKRPFFMLMLLLVLPALVMWVSVFLKEGLGYPALFDALFLELGARNNDLGAVILAGINFLLPGLAFLASLVLWKRSQLNQESSTLPTLILLISMAVILATGMFLFGENILPELKNDL